MEPEFSGWFVYVIGRERERKKTRRKGGKEGGKGNEDIFL